VRASLLTRLLLALAVTPASGCLQQDLPVLEVRPGWGGCGILDVPGRFTGVQLQSANVVVKPKGLERVCSLRKLNEGLCVNHLQRTLASGVVAVDVYLLPQAPQLGGSRLSGDQDGESAGAGEVLYDGDCDTVARALNPQQQPQLLTTFQGDSTHWYTPVANASGGQQVTFQLNKNAVLLIDATYRNDDPDHPLEQATCLNLEGESLSVTTPECQLPVSSLFDDVPVLGNDVVRECTFPETLNVLSIAGFFSEFGLQDTGSSSVELEMWPWDGTLAGPDPIYDRTPDANVAHWTRYGRPRMLHGIKIHGSISDPGNFVPMLKPSRLGTQLIYYSNSDAPLNARCFCHFEGKPRDIRLSSGEDLPCPPEP
jgi:hypothetical protein